MVPNLRINTDSWDYISSSSEEVVYGGSLVGSKTHIQKIGLVSAQYVQNEKSSTAFEISGTTGGGAGAEQLCVTNAPNLHAE